MKLKYTAAFRFLLILVFLYAVSIRTAAAQSRGRLIVTRDPSLGRNVTVTLRIDGRTVANLMQGSRFDNPVWTGRRVLSVSAVNNSFHFPWSPPNIVFRSTSTTVHVRRGRTYTFTAVWRRPDRVVLVPGRSR